MHMAVGGGRVELVHRVVMSTKVAQHTVLQMGKSAETLQEYIMDHFPNICLL